MSELSNARKKIEDIDEKMAVLFQAHMSCVEDIADYKKRNSIPVLDTAREKELIERNEQYIGTEGLKPYYRQFIRAVMDISRQYQHDLLKENEIIKENGK